MLHYRQTGRFGRELWKQARPWQTLMRESSARLRARLPDAPGDRRHGSRAGQLDLRRPLPAALAATPSSRKSHGWVLVQSRPPAPRTRRSIPSVRSALYYDIAFAEGTAGTVQRPAYPTGGTLRENYKTEAAVRPDPSTLPRPIADIILKAMIEVFYQDGKHPAILRDNDGRPSSQLIEDTYDLHFASRDDDPRRVFARAPGPAGGMAQSGLPHLRRPERRRSGERRRRG